MSLLTVIGAVGEVMRLRNVLINDLWLMSYRYKCLDNIGCLLVKIDVIRYQS